MAKIRLITGEAVEVDRQDFAILNLYSWRNVNGYAARNENGSTIYMHRQLLDPPSDLQIDHKNGNRLDNRRRNLRIATAAQNMANRKGWGASPYKGVYAVGRRWRSLIMHDGRLKSLGVFDTPEAAAIAFNGAAKLIHGEFALLNDVQG